MTIASLAIFLPECQQITGTNDYYHGNLFDAILDEYQVHEGALADWIDYHDGFRITFADNSALRYYVGVDGPHDGGGRLVEESES